MSGSFRSKTMDLFYLEGISVYSINLNVSWCGHVTEEQFESRAKRPRISGGNGKYALL